MPCMVHKEIDTTLITSLEGTSRTSVLCLVSINHFLPPAVFQKLLAICIKKWPIVEQQGQKLIFCGVCKFNLDESKNYKLTVFQVGYAVHARVVSYSREEHLPQAVCGSVYEVLVQSLRSVLRGMGFADMFRICIQCPDISALENSGYIDMSVVEVLDGVTCDDCRVPHSIQSQKLLEGWIKRVTIYFNISYTIVDFSDGIYDVIRTRKNNTDQANALVNINFSGAYHIRTLDQYIFSGAYHIITLDRYVFSGTFHIITLGQYIFFSGAYDIIHQLKSS